MSFEIFKLVDTLAQGKDYESKKFRIWNFGWSPESGELNFNFDREKPSNPYLPFYRVTFIWWETFDLFGHRVYSNCPDENLQKKISNFDINKSDFSMKLNDSGVLGIDFVKKCLIEELQYSRDEKLKILLDVT